MIKPLLKKIIAAFLAGSLFISSDLNAAQDDFIGYQLIERPPQHVLRGKLILSDSPEEVKSQGILYEEQVNGGMGRVLFHHINASYTPKRLVVIAKNKEETATLIKVLKKEVVGPTKHVVHAGKKLLEQYFSGKGKEEIIVPPYGSAVLYESKGSSWSPQLLLTGILDFKISGKVDIIIAAVLPAENNSVISELPYLQRDCHPRGTFSILEEYYALHLPSFGKYYMCMEQDEDWAVGKDGITQEITMNRGNYGIMYHITIQTESDTSVQFVPRAGVFKGVIKWEEGELCPIERTHYFKHYKEPVDLGILKAHETKTLSYMLPNGSAAPVWLQFEVLVNKDK